MNTEEFKTLLCEKRIIFYEKEGLIIISGQDDVYLRSLTKLPDNVKFENQGYVYLRSLTTLPDNVKFENQGSVYLRSLTTLPDNVKFENQGSVDLRSLTTLPDNVKFENQGDVNLRSLTTLPDNVKFENQGSVYLSSLTKLPDNVKFENQGSVNLSSLTTLPDNVKFENQGSVYLSSLTKLPDNVKFENQGSVDLRSLTTLPDNVKFENQGYVSLRSLTTLPDNVKFENQGSVYLCRLTTEEINYMGKSLRFKTIDGYTMILLKKKKIGVFETYSARYFGGGEIDKLKECFLASAGDFWAHGSSLKEAIEDVRFKSMSVNFDKEEMLNEVRKSQRVQVVHYRLMTGACREGCRQFLRNNDYDEDTESLPLKDVIRLIPNQYGSEKALELLEPILTN